MKNGTIIFSRFVDYFDAGKAMYANGSLHFLHGLTPITGWEQYRCPQHHRKSEPIQILSYTGRTTQENKTKESKRRNLPPHRVFCMQRK
jgi:hypothetical protein